MRHAVLLLLLCCSTAMANPPTAPAQTPQPAQSPHPVQTPASPTPDTQPDQAIVIEHVPPQRSPDAQHVEDRCVRTTTSHAATDRDTRQTKGTQGTHGECAGQGFRGDGGADIMSGLQSPATTH